LLDTSVISELVKPKPELRVLNWVAQADEELLHVSVLTLGEIRKQNRAVAGQLSTKTT